MYISTEIKAIDDTNARILDDLDKLKVVMEGTPPGSESELLRLLLARVTINHMFQFTGLLDAQGRMIESSYPALNFLNLQRSEVLGQHFEDTPWWQGVPEWRQKLIEALEKAKKGEFIRYDTEAFMGEILTIDMSITPIKDRHGQVLLMIVEGRDVTEQRRLEREVSRQREELAQLDKLKSQFFANISHEFRTPLTLMLGPVKEALTEVRTATPAIQSERLEIVQRNAMRLLKMVNQLLEFSALEANRVQASFQATDLSVLTAELAGMFHSAVDKAGMTLEVDCPRLPEPIYVDRDLWEKIVLNLLSNAFKHTFEGRITIRLEWQKNQVTLTVQDTGVGIPAEQLPKLFERFHRISETRSRTYEGSGIGLALVHELVALHHGTIRVESAPGLGSTFTVSLPTGKAYLPPEQIRPETATEKDPTRAQAFAEEAMGWLPKAEIKSLNAAWEQDGAWCKSDNQKVKILLAEDNADMRSYIYRLLAPHCDVESVPDGEAALEAARRHIPDLILSDIMMPKMDGLQLLSNLREDPILRTVPIILLSARAGEEAKLGGLEQGADDYLVKPFDKRELLARVKANLNLELHRMTQEAEKARQVSETRFQRIVDSNIIGIFSGKLNGLVTEANDYVLNMLGYTREELDAGKLDWQEITPAEFLESDASRGKEFLQQRFLMPYEKQFLHKSGRRVDAAIGAVLETTKDDFICYVLDISDRKKAEANLKDYAKRLEHSNKDLEQFATIASHDLQEPLRKVLMFTDHLKKALELNEEATDDLERIQRATSKMQRLINDLLDLSKVTRRGSPFRKMDLGALIDEVIAESSYSFEGIREQVEISGSMEIEADANQMRQMLLQLLDNALKFHKADQRPSVKILIQSAPKKQCQLVISDNGIGMKTEHLGRIFDVFTRLHHGTEYSGTGIGLALVKKIVERHNGAIMVESELDKGSTFTITLPVFQK